MEEGNLWVEAGYSHLAKLWPMSMIVRRITSVVPTLLTRNSFFAAPVGFFFLLLALIGLSLGGHGVPLAF